MKSFLVKSWRTHNFWLKRWLHLPGLHLDPVYSPEEGMTLDGLLFVTEPQALAGILGQKLACEIVVKIYFCCTGDTYAFADVLCFFAPNSWISGG